MKTRKPLLFAGLVLGLTLAGTALAGDGLVIAKGKLPQASREKLADVIKVERTEHAERFTALFDVMEKMPDVEKQTRGRAPSLSRAMKALGKDAFAPLVEAIAFDATPSGLSPKARLGMEMSLLEALGALRDERALPVFVSVAKASDKDAWVRRVATEGLGALGSDAAVKELVALGESEPIVLGLGECRREKIALHLASILDKKTDKAVRRAAIQSLGGVGNALAWTTSAVRAHADEEKATRDTAMRALAKAFVANEGDLRTEAAVALRIVRAEGTRDVLVDLKKGTSGETAAALDELIAKF